jgi:hypothetical protein
MDSTRLLALVGSAAVLGWLLAPHAARSEPQAAEITTRSVEYTAQCFVDSVTERRWCERRADVARLIDCTEADTLLTCRVEYMQLMGRSAWPGAPPATGTSRRCSSTNG